MTSKQRYFTLIRVAIRVPKRGELYINKNGEIQRCKEDHYSRRSQKRVIVRENF